MSRVARALERWGPEPPEWIMALARRADATSQSRVAREIGRSTSYVSCLIGKSYSGDMRAAQELIEGVYLSSTVSCPALGEIGTDRCLAWRRRAAGPFSSNNALTISMYRACRHCPRFRESPEAEDPTEEDNS